MAEHTDPQVPGAGPDGDAIAARYAHDGYAFPLTAMSPSSAATCRRLLESAEARAGDDPVARAMLLGKTNLVLPAADEITRLPGVLEAVRRILGPDLLVWGANLFLKEARSAAFVSWHQDLTYWGLDDTAEVTAWVALSPATRESGCMRFLAGSHRGGIVEHRDTFSAANMLTRGQEVTAAVDESAAVDVVLQPGQMSLHDGRLLHASHPNGSGDRRIGLAIRYISPAMRQTSGARLLARLVSGEDRYGHFELAPPPRGTLTATDLDTALRATRLAEQVLYADAGQRGRRLG